MPPIERPSGLVTKLAYAISRRHVGKVLMPLRVVNVRLPMAFGMFVDKISKLDRKLELPAELILLVRVGVAQINVCTICTDVARSFVIQASMVEVKLESLGEYGSSQLFVDAERAALDYSTESTREKQVNPEKFARPSPGRGVESWFRVHTASRRQIVDTIGCPEFFYLRGGVNRRIAGFQGFPTNSSQMIQIPEIGGRVGLSLDLMSETRHDFARESPARTVSIW